MIAAARLDARTAYIAQVGDDPFGRDLLALWCVEGVATDGVCTLAGSDTGLYFVSHGPAGHEFSYRRAGSGAARMTPADLPRPLLQHTRWLRWTPPAPATVLPAPACRGWHAAPRRRTRPGSWPIWPRRSAPAASGPWRRCGVGPI